MALRATIDNLLRKFEKDFATHNRIEVSKSALLHNFDLFAKISDKQVIPVLKGNAYGHGIEQAATTLKSREFPYIAVDGYFEALRVRKVSGQPVLIMGAIKPENFAKLKYDRFAFVVQDETTIRALAATRRQLAVHLECNTGMNRYGAPLAELATLTKLILSYPNLRLEGVMSHLADSDGMSETTVTRAVDAFDRCVEIIRENGASPELFHIAQTAGSLRAASRYANAMRLGIGLYGINPFPPEHRCHAKLAGLQPALQLVSTITKTIDLKKGESVSYNYTFTAPKNMRIGILPLGYYEGVPRVFSNSGMVKYDAAYPPVVGRVCMNHTIISLDGTSAAVGSEVVVFSTNPKNKNSVDNAAKRHELFNYNVLTALSPDVRRVLVE